MGKKLTLIALHLLLTVLIITFITAPPAMASGSRQPQDIYDDFVSNGNKVVASYSSSELTVYLNDATLHEYGDASVLNRLDDLARQMLNRSTFPVSGFQMAVAGVVIVLLIGGGLLLRRFSRRP